MAEPLRIVGPQGVLWGGAGVQESDETPHRIPMVEAMVVDHDLESEAWSAEAWSAEAWSAEAWSAQAWSAQAWSAEAEAWSAEEATEAW